MYWLLSEYCLFMQCLNNGICFLNNKRRTTRSTKIFYELDMFLLVILFVGGPNVDIHPIKLTCVGYYPSKNNNIGSMKNLCRVYWIQWRLKSWPLCYVAYSNAFMAKSVHFIRIKISREPNCIIKLRTCQIKAKSYSYSATKI